MAVSLLYLHAFHDGSPAVALRRRRDRRAEDAQARDAAAALEAVLLGGGTGGGGGAGGGGSGLGAGADPRLGALAALTPRAVFEAAPAWTGPRPGAVFKLGILGLGYYKDSVAYRWACVCAHMTMCVCVHVKM